MKPTRRDFIKGGVSAFTLSFAAPAFISDLAMAQGSKAGDVRVVLPPSEVVRQRGRQSIRTVAQKGMTLYYQDVLETGVGGRLRAARVAFGEVFDVLRERVARIGRYQHSRDQGALLGHLQDRID